MKITFISDLHDRFTELAPLPPGDVLCVCGDATNSGSFKALSLFFRWCGIQPFRYVLFVPGNHDKIMDVRGRDAQAVRNARELEGLGLQNDVRTLIDRSVFIGNFRFYGTPWTLANTENRAFKLDSEAKLAEKYALIPSDVDVLLTHQPPKGILSDDLKGSNALFDRLVAGPNPPRPRVHAFGHAHDSGGLTCSFLGTTFVNAAVMNREHEFHAHPFVTLEL